MNHRLLPLFFLPLLGALKLSSPKMTSPSDIPMKYCQVSEAGKSLDGPVITFFPRATGTPLLQAGGGKNISGFEVIPGGPVGEGRYLPIPFGAGWHLTNMDLKVFDTTCELAGNDPTGDGNLHGTNFFADKTGDAAARQTIQRIGPFPTYGGFDFWEMCWSDVGHLSKKFEQHPDGLYVSSYNTVVVDEEGTVLPLPPIHVHHFHMAPKWWIFTKYKQQKVKDFSSLLAAKEELEKTYGNWITDQSGNYLGGSGGDGQCDSHLGGMACFNLEMPKDSGMLIKDPLETEGVLNDVRIPDSPEMNWWLQISLSWTPKTSDRKMRAMSSLFINNPFPLFSLYVVKTDQSYLVWHCYPVPRSGHVHSVRLHFHVATAKHIFMFNGSPGTLGLAPDPDLKVWDPIPLTKVGKGFHSPEEFVQSMFEKGKQPNSPNKLLCSRAATQENVGGFLYDRANYEGKPICGDFELKQGDNIVALAVYGELSSNLALGIDLVRDRKTPTPIFMQHCNVIMHYDAIDEKSHFEVVTGYQDCSVKNHNPEGVEYFSLKWYLSFLR